MTIVLKDYQQEKIGELLEKSKRLLEYSGTKKLVFKSPTGSGKTVMMAEFLKMLVEDREVKQSLGIIWTAPRQLHIQSKEKLEGYFEGTRALRCSFFEDLEDGKIGENEILFFNWESINKTDNIYIRDNEQDLNLSKIIEGTREEGREIILVIDEAHHHATSEISQGLIAMMNPKLTIEVSATPVIQNPDEMVVVPLEDVKASGMIKRAVILNDQFENISKEGKIETALSGGSEEFVLDISLEKRNELLQLLNIEGSDVNPLILIQLPDRIGELEDTVKDRVIGILKDKYATSVENGKLAIWLSGEHINKEEIEKNTNEVEVLLFKQAIALGWDCPRAQILVLFREWHSPIFSIQTLGRIMRMPEPSRGYFASDKLNYAYVYTNIDNVIINEDIPRGYVTCYTSKRKSTYQPINLLSCYQKRYRERTRLSPLFNSIFLGEADHYDLAKKIDVKQKNINMKIISDYKKENIDEMVGLRIIGDKKILASAFDLQRLFEFFVRKNLTPFYPEDRSLGRIKESIYRFFELKMNMKYEEAQEEIVQIILDEVNCQHFVNVIDAAKAKYKEEVEKREPEIIDKNDWNVPESLPFGEDDVKESVNKCIMEPFFDAQNNLEKAFIELLEKSRKVEWWFKNGVRDSTFFAIPYEENGSKRPFYVDFIVQFEGGEIGLFDTKSGLTLKVAGPKASGLYSYIQNQNEKGKKLFGGIVTNTEQRKYTGKWIYFNEIGEKLKPSDFGNWKTLDF